MNYGDSGDLAVLRTVSQEQFEAVVNWLIYNQGIRMDYTSYVIDAFSKILDTSGG